MSARAPADSRLSTTTRSRHRSSSDPFSDPRLVLRPPVPPPKHYPVMESRPRDNILDAVRDTVSLSPRKPARSQTAVPSIPKLPQSIRQRSHSEDSVTRAANFVERAKAKSGRPKKASQHSDVIDRLDFTGVGPMFHHDGPFDACAPSRNRHKTRAPMLAWSSHPDDPITTSSSTNDSAYPTPDVYKDTFSGNYYDPPKKKVDAIAEAWGMHEPEPFEDFSAGGGSGRPDGDTPNSSIYNGREGYRSAAKRSKDGRDLREVYREYLDEGQHQTQQKEARRMKRSTLPPPQPIFVPDANHPDVSNAPPLLSPPLGSPKADTPKRNKSLMQRFRKMRDSPNVPVGNYEDELLPPSPTNVENSYPPTRPTHRQKDSFLGRLGGGANHPKENISPTSDVYDQGKALPATPFSRDGRSTPLADQDTHTLGYFDDRIGSSNGYSSPNGGTGRTTTILRKVKGVVKGTK